jgi:hypothetical protein
MRCALLTSAKELLLNVFMIQVIRWPTTLRAFVHFDIEDEGLARDLKG